MTADHNEQTTLLAAVLNNVAVAFAVFCFVTPITAMSFGPADHPALRQAIAFLAAIWLCAAVGLQWVEKRVLRSITCVRVRSS